MSQKKYRIHTIFLRIPEFKPKAQKRLSTWYSQVTSLECALRPTINNTGWFFKKLAFIGLAYTNVIQKHYRIVTLKSVMRSL